MNIVTSKRQRLSDLVLDREPNRDVRLLKTEPTVHYTFIVRGKHTMYIAVQAHQTMELQDLKATKTSFDSIELHSKGFMNDVVLHQEDQSSLLEISKYLVGDEKFDEQIGQATQSSTQ